MFESHFGLRENPFASGHQSRFVYPSHEHQEALAHLRYGIGNLESFVLITGEVGTGKTTALFEAVVELQARVSVALITNSALTRGELLEEICLRFGVGVTPAATKPQAMARLEQHLLALRGRGERAILLLDEAQNFDRELLEEIRLFSNLEAGGENLMQIILVGQPELEAKLSLPELRQLRQRIPVHYRLHPLSLEETERYILHRVSVAGGDAPRVFPPETCAAVHAITNGIPREINQICAQAMLDAYVEGLPSVSPQHVRSAAQEATFQSVLPTSETGPLLPPLPAWPAALPPPSLAAPTVQSEAPQTVTEASPGEAWASSSARPPQSADPTPAPPASPAPALEVVQRIEVPRAPEFPATPPQAGPGTRYAAESALKPPVPEAPGARTPRVGAPPSRLYDRMRDEEPESPSHVGIKWLVGIAAVALVIIAAILMFRFGPWAKPETPVPPVVPIVTTLPTDTLPRVLKDSTVALQSTGSTATDTSVAMSPETATAETSFAAPAQGTGPPPSAIAKPVVPPPPAAPVTTKEFSLSVGTYLDRARAESELARIGGASGLTGRIAELLKEGTTMYAVIIGAFPDHDTAERKASELVSSGTLDEARVISRTVRVRP
jgi:type II secretory pathway predicted ATPase ExeA